MDSIAIEPSRNATTPNFGVPIGENHGTMLKESIDRFFVECEKGLSDFSGFLNIFFRFLQARIDPPLETIWFYSALSFRSANVDVDEQCGLSRVSRARDLFQLLTACSVSCDGVKSVAVMAPVLVELYGAAVEALGVKGLGKKEKKLMNEVESLLEGILSYASMRGCRGYDWESGSIGLLPCFPDLIRVWTKGESGGDCEIIENLRMFFPLLSEEVCSGFVEGEFGVGHLAGVVIVEAFLLKLCLKLKSGGDSKSDLMKELRIWAVGAITGSQNRYFFEILFRMLLESALPVSSLLDSEDVISLRRIIYDALILVEYSILSPEGEIQLGSYSIKNFALSKLIVVYEAIQFVREIGDHAKAIYYLDAFSRSQLRSFLIKWAANQAAAMGKASKPDVPTPHSLIKWLLKLEDQGVVAVFDGKISKLRAKLVEDFSKQDNERLPFQLEGEEEDVFYVIDSRAEEEEDHIEEEGKIESMDAAFLAAAHAMKMTSNGGRRKRKDGQERKGVTMTKYLREHIDDRRVKQDFLVDDGRIGSGSEVENPLSGEDSDLMEE